MHDVLDYRGEEGEGKEDIHAYFNGFSTSVRIKDESVIPQKSVEQRGTSHSCDVAHQNTITR